MIEIKFTLDATPELIGAMRDLAGAIHSVPRPMHAMQNTQNDCSVDAGKGTVICDAVDNGQNLTNEVPVDPEQAEAQPSNEGPKKRKPRAKRAQSEGNPPVAPAVGDKLSPDGDAEPELETQEETNAPDTAPETATDIDPTVTRMDGIDPLAGKGQTGEILAELTRKAIGDLDALGVDRGDANRRIRAYCDYHEIKFATFPALLHAVGYAEAIAVCKGE